jgi:D-amino-acid dehydrogenase
VLRDAGVKFQQIDAQATRALEPALNPDTAFLGAIHLPDDEAGNCRQFAILLKDQARGRRPVRVQLRRCAAGPGCAPTLGLVQGDAARQVRFDAVVVCGGSSPLACCVRSACACRSRRCYGYSISAPIREPLNAPRSALMDERYKVAITRLGSASGWPAAPRSAAALGHKRAAALQTLYKVLHDWFPGAAQLSNTGAAVQEWKGARPMLPDGPPSSAPRACRACG